jgi:L-ribulose-5-phosphate 3-epimerase
MKMTRRAAIGHTVALTLSTQLAPLLAAPAQRRFKIGACQWSLRRGDESCFDLAKEIGLDGVEVNMGNAANGMHLRKPERQRAYLDAARRTGVEIASLGMAELNNIPLKSDPRAAVWLLDSIPVAKELEVEVVLVAQFFNGDLKNDKAGTDRTVGVLKEVAPRAAQAGIILGLENYLSAEENLDILDRVGSSAVQVYYDVGNSTDKGYDIYREIRMLKGRICAFHAKDGEFLLGQGRIDFARVREAIDAIAFEGWIQIEGAAPNGVVPDYRANLAHLREHFQRAPSTGQTEGDSSAC